MADFFLVFGLVRLHTPYHAGKEPVYGISIIEEFARHGYRLSPGTLYPLLHDVEERGYLKASVAHGGRRFRRLYRATARGRRALADVKAKVGELFEDE